MVLLNSPLCKFGEKYKDFRLLNIDEKEYSLRNITGHNGTLIMFICNHCPYVKAVINNIVEDCKNLKDLGINSIAICSNDATNYPEDSFDKMIEFSNENKFSFPYVHDETQEIARKFGAVCTPDFFGYNSKLELQYRGRMRELIDLKPINNGESDLKKAMTEIVKSGIGPKKQIPSMGCNIKWFKN